MNKSLPIGIFDSGIGGLTVLKALQDLMPTENFVYFADTARLPYGDKTPQQIHLYFHDIAQWMMAYGVKALVVACNTSSAIVLQDLVPLYPFPIIGTIEPTAVRIPSTIKHIGVIATAATVNSMAYEKALMRHNPHLDVSSMACPALVPLIERHQWDGEEVSSWISHYLTPMVESNIDGLIYGCTHYPYLSHAIKKFLPDHVEIIDPALAIAQEVQQVLGTENKAPHHPPYFYTTGDLTTFATILTSFYGHSPLVQHAHLKVAA